jgi:asparagine synthase (glutamine-hydrolysing)
MLRVGKTSHFRLEVQRINGVLKVDGPSSGFCGYQFPKEQHPEGVFVEWFVRNDCFYLSNDRFGMYPAFYRSIPGKFLVSSTLMDLVASTDLNDLNDAAISVFLRTGFFPGDSTPFNQIKALPPGVSIRFQDGLLKLQSSGVYSGDATHLTIEQAQEEMAARFSKAVSHLSSNTESESILPLSGGRDSRHILFELIKQKRPPKQCATVRYSPPNDFDDVRIAAELCRELGINHVVLDQDNSFLLAENEKNQLSNFLSAEHAWMLPIRKFVESNKYDMLYDGIGGDVLTNGMFLSPKWLNLAKNGKIRVLAEEILGPEGYLPKILSGEAYRKFNRQIAIKTIEEELDRHQFSSNPIGQFFFWNRTRRHVAQGPWGILKTTAMSVAPYLTTDLYDVMTGLPAEYFLDGRFHDKVLLRVYPEFPCWRFAEKGKRSSPPFSFSHIPDLVRICQLLFRPGLALNAYRPQFTTPRLLFSFISRSYFDSVKNVYRVPVWFNQLVSECESNK